MAEVTQTFPVDIKGEEAFEKKLKLFFIKIFFARNIQEVNLAKKLHGIKLLNRKTNINYETFK